MRLDILCKDGMVDKSSRAHPERLLDFLHSRFGDAVRSCVEYTPNSSRIHYLRDDIESNRTQAEARLVRIEELYQAERLAATPLIDDSDLGRLSASFHLFEGALVIHLIDSSSRVIGVSLEPDAFAALAELSAESLDAVYGDSHD